MSMVFFGITLAASKVKCPAICANLFSGYVLSACHDAIFYRETTDILYVLWYSACHAKLHTMGFYCAFWAHSTDYVYISTVKYDCIIFWIWV